MAEPLRGHSSDGFAALNNTVVGRLLTAFADIAIGLEDGDGDPRTGVVSRRSSSGTVVDMQQYQPRAGFWRGDCGRPPPRHSIVPIRKRPLLSFPDVGPQWHCPAFLDAHSIAGKALFAVQAPFTFENLHCKPFKA